MVEGLCRIKMGLGGILMVWGAIGMREGIVGGRG